VSTGFLKGVMAWLGPVLLVWTAFAAFYAFMPNTRVKVSAALIGGIVSGTLWLALLWAYKTGQVKIGSYNVIYGSLAALPVFLMWLYFSWVITLFGAEVAFAYEHVETYRRKMENYRPSPAARERIALRVYFEIASAFHKGAAAPDGEALDRALRIPVRAVREVLEDLEGASLIARVETGSGGGFQPARDLAVVTPGGVVAAVRDAGDRVSAGDGPLWREALRLADGLESRLAEGDYARSISDIIAAGDAEAKS
jgi:membrane protein